jgi:GNAT superfamily N-acetyltransferase
LDDGVAAEIVSGRLALLYRLDAEGLLVESNEPYAHGDPAPVAHVCLGSDAMVFGLRAGLPDAAVRRLEEALSSFGPLLDLTDQTITQRVWKAVRSIPPVAKIGCGPVYRFPEDFSYPTNAVLVDDHNSAVLVPKDPDLVRALPYVKPCFAVVVDGRAVSICHTVRVCGRYREAGVDTSEAYRRRGYATAVVAAWAQEVIRDGCVPVYSTAWDNHGSVAVARRLGLELVAAELEIEE